MDKFGVDNIILDLDTRYFRSNYFYEELSVDVSIVDLSNVGANILELINVDTNNELILDLNL